MKIYKSKIGKELIIPMSIIIGGISILFIIEGLWIGLLIHFAFILLILHLFSKTYYVVEGNQLRIKAGFLVNMLINIDEIRKINETRNPISSPALSLDRLEIVYKKYDRVYISPREKAEFIQDMLMLNPNINVKYRVK
jgi:hypothetical protein